MSLMKNYLLLSVALVTLVMSVAGRGQASAAQASASSDPAAGLAILNRSCTSCHDASQIKQARPAADWQPIIERMRGNGAAISDSDAKILLDYLIKNYAARP